MSNEQRLHQVIAAFLLAAEAGQAPDRQDLLNRHPDLAPELLAFFADHDRLKELAAPLLPPKQESPAEMPTLAPPTSATATPLGTIRYLGDYELLEEIARGGMGIVFRARQVSANRVVAVKLILAGQLSSADEVRRFRTEAEAAASLDHPHIVPIFEVGEHQGQQFYSMKLVQGGSLGQQLAQSPLAPRQAAQLLETVARAVHYAHQRGIIHRDLKPANILLSFSRDAQSSERSAGANAQGPCHDIVEANALRSEDSASRLNGVVPYVTDFGLAKRVEGDAGLTQTGVIVGTPSYMAPEQAEGRGKRVGPAADVYALGAILYECLTGRPPFKAATALDTIMQLLADEPVPPRQLNVKVPHDVETICLKCLHKRPEKRYSTAEALAEDLARWQRGEPVLARPVSVRERAVKWARRRPAVAGLLAGIVLVTATALAVITGLYRNAVWQAGEAAREARRAQEQEALAGRQKNRAEEQLDRAERLLYATQIQAAQREWDAGNVAMAREHLESCRWDFRNVEYGCLCTLFNDDHITLKGHKGPVYSVAISSDGTRIVSGSGGYDSKTQKAWSELKVWDALSGEDLFTRKGATGPGTISSDGTRIVSTSSENTVVCDSRSGKVLLTLQGHTKGVHVHSMAISSDGTRIVSGSGGYEPKTRKSWGEVKVWDGRTGENLLTLKEPTAQVLSVAISSDGSRIVSAGTDIIVKVWDGRSGKVIRTLEGHTGAVSLVTKRVAMSSDGTRIVSASGGEVKVWDSRSDKAVFTLEGHTNRVTSVVFSSDGSRIVSGSDDKTVKVWDARTGKNLLTLQGHTSGVCAVAISNDARRIVSGSIDGEMKVWDARTDKEDAWGNSVAISSDGTRLVTGSHSNTVMLWDARSGKVLLPIMGHNKSVYSVAISSDGTRIVSGGADNTVRVWDARSAKELLALKGHTGDVNSVAICSDGSRIVSGSADKTVKVWDSRSGKVLLTLEGHTKGVYSVVISSDGMRIVSGGEDGVKVWDALSGKYLLTLEGASGPVAISSDGTRIASSDGSTVKVWDIRTGKALLSLMGHTRGVNSVAISSDGTRIVSGSRDGTVKLWDAISGKELLTLKGATGPVAISSDGGCIVSGIASDNWAYPPVKVWDARSGKDLLFLKGNSGPVSRVAISSDGKRVFAQEDGGKILAWDLATGQLLPDPPEAMPSGGQQASTADGTLRVRIENGVIRVVRADLEQERQQREARNRDLLERLARFDPDWHQEQLNEATAAKDDFASAFHLYALARGCARSIPLADKPESRQKQAARAVDWLRQAAARGYKDVAHMKQDTDLDALRGRDDFKKVLAEVEAAARPQKTKEP